MRQRASKIIIGFLLLLLIAGCDNSGDISVIKGQTMGSTYSIKYVHNKDNLSAEYVQKGVERILAEVDQQISTYRSDSLLSKFNQLPDNRCMSMPSTLVQLTRFGQQLSVESQGAFDLTVEPLLNIWGFGPQSREERVPSAKIIAETKLQVGYQNIQIKSHKLCKIGAVQLDFDSLGAGYTVDKITQYLSGLGLESFLIDVTGELKAVGVKPNNEPWKIAIEAPKDNVRVAQKVIELDGYGISTSGDYRNYFEQNGVRYSHTIDPRTGRPIVHRLASVTVINASVLKADAFSTLLMVLGQKEGMIYANKHDIPAFFVIRTSKGFKTSSSAMFKKIIVGGVKG